MKMVIKMMTVLNARKRTDKNLNVTENMGTKILAPVKRPTKLRRNKDKISAILKSKFRFIKENNITDKMIAFFEKENKAAR